MKNSHSDPCLQLTLNESSCYDDAYCMVVTCVMRRFWCHISFVHGLVLNLFNVSWSLNFPAKPDEAMFVHLVCPKDVLSRIKLKHITWVDLEKCVGMFQPL